MHEKKALVFMRMVLQPRRINILFGALRQYAIRRRRKESVYRRMDEHYVRTARRHAVRLLRRHRAFSIALVRRKNTTMPPPPPSCNDDTCPSAAL